MGNKKDIAPFVAPKFEDNVILTATEMLMMSKRPKNPINARNKNVLIVGESDSGKTGFFIKPNLLKCCSKSFPVLLIVTGSKGGVVCERGNSLLHYGYLMKFFNSKCEHLEGLLNGGMKYEEIIDCN